MARRNRGSLEELLELLTEMPWWASVVVAALVYGVLRFVGPAIFPDAKTLPGMLVGVGSQLAWMSVILLAPAPISLFRAAGKSRMLDHQSSIESIRALSWKRFEELLGEAYRRQGFTVFENAGKGADGGIDLTIRRGAETYLVQCKQWKTYKVGVTVVREMLGLVTAHGATGAIVVTSGVFTREAEAFAATQQVELVDGDALVRLIGEVQVRPAMAVPTPTSTPVARICPRCGQDLVLRQAKRGPNAGGQFWGCSGYPQCRHTEQVGG